MTRARSLSRLANTNAFTVDASQNVGIGSTLPDVRLDVNGDMNVTGTLTYEDVTNVATAGVTTTGGLVVTGLGATIGGITTFFGDLNFGAAGVGGTITTLGHAEFAGVVTATSFSGDGSGLTGVASTDNINTSTLAQFTGGVGIADSIFHIGDDNTAIRFPAADTFTVETAGGEALRVDSSQRLLVGTDTGQGNSLLQVEGDSSSAAAQGSLSLRRGLNTAAIGGNIGADLGKITFGANDGTVAATIISQSDAAWSSTSDCPGNIQFLTTPDGASSPTERLRIDSSGRVIIGATSARVVGTNRQFTIEGTDSATSSASIFRNSNSSGGAVLALGKSRGTTDGSNTVLQSGDQAAAIFFHGADGTDAVSQVASISAEIDGTPGSRDMPGRLVFSTTPDGSYIVAERLRIGSSGQIGLGGANYGTAGQVLTSNGSGSAVTWEDASGGGGITTQVGNASGIVTSMFLNDATDHKVTATGICTITTTQSGTEGQSHTIRIVNSGIATVGFSTYFLFPSGNVPDLPTADGAVSLISFTVHDSVGAGCTQLLAGVSVNFS